MSCKSICIKYKATGGIPRGGRYQNGQKRCQICDIFVTFDGLFCPCCGMRLRNKPRNHSCKQRATRESRVVRL